MSYYAERNGLAKYWERNSISQNLDYWARYHPEEIAIDPTLFKSLVDKLLQYDVNLFDLPEDVTQYNIDIYINKIRELTGQDIDDITGVNLNAGN